MTPVGVDRLAVDSMGEPQVGVPSAAPISPAAHRWTMLAGLSLASFLLTLGDTALAVALPSLGRDLGLSLSGLEWVINAYTLALSVFLLAGGWLTDLLGARRVLQLGLLLFTGSLARLRVGAERLAAARGPYASGTSRARS